MNANQLEETIFLLINEASQEAHATLISIFEDPSSIALFLECLQSTQHNSIKLFCLTTIRRMIIDRSDSFPIEMQQNIFSSITNLIENEADNTLRDNMGEFITILKLDPEAPSSISCVEFALSLIQTKQVPLVSTAFFIIYNSYNSLPPEQQQEIFQTILPTSIEHLLNPDTNCRLNSMRLIINLLFEDEISIDDDPNTSSLFNDLSNAILQNVNRINTEPFEFNEPGYVYGLANVAIKNCKYFDEYIPAFTEMFLTFLSNTEIDVMSRYNALENINQLFETAIDQIEPYQPKLIEGCISLAVEIATNEPDIQDVIDDIIDWFQSSLSPDEAYQIFSEAAGALISSNDIVQARVAFDIFSCIVEESVDSVNDDMDSIINHLLTYLEPKNITDGEGNIIEFIPISCAKVIISLCENNPNGVLPHVEKLIPLLFNYIWIKECMDAIKRLTTVTYLPPEKCEEYLQQTLTWIESSMSDQSSNVKADPELLIEMLISLLEMINRQNESIYSTIMPLVQLIIESPNFTPSQKMLAAQLFGILVKICPQSATDEIDNFVQFSLGLFSSDDSETNLSVVEFLEIILLNQSKYIAPYINDLFESLQKLFYESKQNIELIKSSISTVPNENEDEEEDDEGKSYISPIKKLVLLQQSILNLLSTICLIYPSQTSGYFEHIFGMHQEFISTQSDKPDLIIGSITDFENLSNAYMSTGSDIYELLMFLINELNNSDIIIKKELWKEISVVMAIGGGQLIKRCAAEIVENLSYVFFKRMKIYNERGNEDEINHKFRNPVFTVLDTFIEELGNECLQFIGEGSDFPLIEVLYSMTNRQNKSQCYAARSLAKIAATLEVENETGDRFANLALQTAMNNYKEKDVNTQICGLTILNVILNFRPDLIDPIKGDLIEFTTSIINKNLAGSPDNEIFLNECVILLFSMVRIYSLASEENIELIRAASDLPALDFDSPDLIPYSLFARYILQFDQENFRDFYMYLLTFIMSSSQLILRKFDHDTLVEFARELSGLSEDEILGILQWNLTKLDLLQSNIAMFLGGDQES